MAENSFDVTGVPFSALLKSPAIWKYLAPETWEIVESFIMSPIQKRKLIYIKASDRGFKSMDTNLFDVIRSSTKVNSLSVHPDIYADLELATDVKLNRDILRDLGSRVNWFPKKVSDIRAECNAADATTCTAVGPVAQPLCALVYRSAGGSMMCTSTNRNITSYTGSRAFLDWWNSFSVEQALVAYTAFPGAANKLVVVDPVPSEDSDHDDVALWKAAACAEHNKNSFDQIPIDDVRPNSFVMFGSDVYYYCPKKTKRSATTRDDDDCDGPASPKVQRQSSSDEDEDAESKRDAHFADFD